ncbi:uncharacterized protein METZ01_LOCUS417647, partial [marine metagenome]
MELAIIKPNLPVGFSVPAWDYKKTVYIIGCPTCSMGTSR